MLLSDVQRESQDELSADNVDELPQGLRKGLYLIWREVVQGAVPPGLLS